MASTFANVFAGTVVFGGLAGIVLWVGTAIFGNDDFINPQTVEIPDTPAQVVSGEGDWGRSVTFSIPEVYNARTLEMAIVSPKHGDPTLPSLGYRYADLRECRAYLTEHQPEMREGSVNYFCCFGSRGDKPNGTYGGMLRYDSNTGEFIDDALNLHDHFLGPGFVCSGQYVGVKL